MVWRRRNYLINKEFQIRYTGRILFGIVVMALVGAFTVYYTTWARIMDAFYNVPQIAAQYATLFSSVNQTMLVILVMFLLAAGVVSIFASHHIAGPMFRFEKTIKAIMSGDLTLRVGLRKTDEFKQFADLLNQLVESLRTNVSSVRTVVLEMDEIINRIQTKGSSKRVRASASALSPEMLEDLQCLSASLDRLQADVNRYKLENN